MGKLIVVPTPVGNLQDMTFRAIEALKSANLILAEDTRQTGILLKHFGITTKMMAHHKFNEHAQLSYASNDAILFFWGEFVITRQAN